MGTDVLFLKQTNVINKKSSPIYKHFTVPPVTRGKLACCYLWRLLTFTPKIQSSLFM